MHETVIELRCGFRLGAAAAVALDCPVRVDEDGSGAGVDESDVGELALLGLDPARLHEEEKRLDLCLREAARELTLVEALDT